jgi:hypothetical protein
MIAKLLTGILADGLRMLADRIDLGKAPPDGKRGRAVAEQMNAELAARKAAHEEMRAPRQPTPAEKNDADEYP